MIGNDAWTRNFFIHRIYHWITREIVNWIADSGGYNILQFTDKNEDR